MQRKIWKREGELTVTEARSKGAIGDIVTDEKLLLVSPAKPTNPYQIPMADLGNTPHTVLELLHPLNHTLSDPPHSKHPPILKHRSVHYVLSPPPQHIRRSLQKALHIQLRLCVHRHQTHFRKFRAFHADFGTILLALGHRPGPCCCIF